MRKWVYWPVGLLILSLVACTPGGANRGTEGTTPVAESESTAAAAENTTANASEEETKGSGELTEWERPGVCRMSYDAALFTQTSSDGTDSFLYKEDTPCPVYVAIQVFTEGTAEEILEGLMLQSGREDVAIFDNSIGAEKIPCQSIFVEHPAEDAVQLQTFYAIDHGDDVVLVETGSYGLIEAGEYADAEEPVNTAIESMLETFVLIGK